MIDLSQRIQQAERFLRQTIDAIRKEARQRVLVEEKARLLKEQSGLLAEQDKERFKQELLQEKMRAAFNAAHEKEKRYESEYLELKKQYFSNLANTPEYDSLKHEVAINEEVHSGLLAQIKQSSVAEGADKDNITVMDYAFTPFAPASPNVRLNMALGAVLGLFLGVVLAFLIEFLDDRVKTSEDLRRVADLPLLGIFPKASVQGEMRQAVLISDNMDSATAESFRSFATNLSFSSSQGAPKVLHVTSSTAKEAKSNVIMNTALAFCEKKDSKVLIIDADTRKPSVHYYLDLNISPGLVDYLSNNMNGKELDDIIQPTIEKDNLYVISAGGSTPNPVPLLSSDRMTELLKYASEHFDHVLIDSPPVLGLSDALVLSNKADATLFVVASHQTKKAQVLHSLERLQQGKGNIIGFMLTKARSGSGSYYYNYQEYYGYKNDRSLIESKDDFDDASFAS